MIHVSTTTVPAFTDTFLYLSFRSTFPFPYISGLAALGQRYRR